MKYGCIGEHLKHSFSKEIHNSLAGYTYDIVEIEKEKLGEFLTRADFSGINVTIPYKEMIIPYLYCIDQSAEEIGAVNTVVNKDGKLYGYNTDFYGMVSLLSHIGISVKGRKAAILGTGGTSKTAYAVLRHLGAENILRVGRVEKENCITYKTLYEEHSDTEIIINTTPLGMYPDIFSSPVDISRFKDLIGVCDAVYNPLRSSLVSDAKEAGIPAEGGLYMLSAQAVRASEIFTERSYTDGELLGVYKKILSEKENIVLLGMPASGKSTVGKLIAKELKREFFDTDTLIEERCKKSIPEIFDSYGECAFRDIEAEVIKDISKVTGAVIATGGGSVLRPENVKALKMNGMTFFIDRPLEKLTPTGDRPLSSTKEAISRRYAERYQIYLSSADVRINADCEAEEVKNKIIGEFTK